MSAPDRVQASRSERHRVFASGRARSLAFTAVTLAPMLIVAATFAFRTGPPGFRHDWLWPSDSRVLERWFVEFGLSAWNPHGLGSADQAASFDWVLAGFASLAALGLSSASVLFVSFAALFAGSALGIGFLMHALAVRIDRINVRLLGITYALAPICFQKTVAGHVLWLVAYAALPWFVGFVWRGCVRKSATAPFICAALLYAFSSSQIQFLVFDAFIMLVIVAAHGGRKRAWLGTAFVVAIGALHNGNALLAPFDRSSGFSLIDFHATRSWEIDMSSPLPDLALLGGYVGYDRAALPPALWWLPRIGAGGLMLLAVIGVVRRLGRPTLVFSIVGLLSLFFASGWYGPFAAPLNVALRQFVSFTIFRELYHVMALYVLALVVLAAIGVSALPRSIATVLTSVTLLAITPFAAGGLNRLVPAITPVSGENQTSFGTKPLRIELPFPEPLSKPGLASGGSDPARMDDDVATTLNAPLFMQWLLASNIGLPEQLSIAGDLGIAAIRVRERRVSFLKESFEPGVGAQFSDFERRQLAMQDRFKNAIRFGNIRSAVQLESSVERDPLQYALADSEIPPGRAVQLTSSFEGNDIHANWVALRLWAWSIPELSNVLSGGVVTRSGAPLSLSFHGWEGENMYVLGAGKAFRLDGIAGIPSPLVSGRYRWWQWSLTAETSHATLRCEGLCSVVRIQISAQRGWAAKQPPSGARGPAVAVAARSTWPWFVEGMLPPARRATLVFGRAFSPGWHLVVDGRDLGPSHRVDGFFNGWSLPGASTGRPILITFAPQRRASIVVACDVVVEAFLLCLLIARRYARARA